MERSTEGERGPRMYLGPLEPRNQKPDDGRRKGRRLFDACLLCLSGLTVPPPHPNKRINGLVKAIPRRQFSTETSNAHREVADCCPSHYCIIAFAVRSVGHPKDDDTGNHLGGGSSRMTKAAIGREGKQRERKTNSLPAAEYTNLYILSPQERKKNKTE